MRFDQISEDRPHQPVKVLILGESGSGKSGSLAALANAGYSLRIMDFDNGVAILRQYLSAEAMKRVYVKTLVDKMKSTGAFITPDGVPQAFLNAMQLLKGWKEDDVDLGPVSSWGENDILVIDSLTFFSRAAMRYNLFLNIGSKEDDASLSRWMHPWPADYGEAQNRIEAFFNLAYGPALKCNIIVLAHILYLGGGGKKAVKDKDNPSMVYIKEVDSREEGKGYPVTIGRALSPYLARYFNTVLLMETVGSGSASRPCLRTVSTEQIGLKSELPNLLPAMIFVDQGKPETGLDKVFKVLKGKGPTPSIG